MSCYEGQGRAPDGSSPRTGARTGDLERERERERSRSPRRRGLCGGLLLSSVLLRTGRAEWRPRARELRSASSSMSPFTMVYSFRKDVERPPAIACTQWGPSLHTQRLCQTACCTMHSTEEPDRALCPSALPSMETCGTSQQKTSATSSLSGEASFPVHAERWTPLKRMAREGRREGLQ